MSTARIDELRIKFDENPRRYFAPLANEYRKAGDLAQAIALCREHLPKQPGHMSGYIVFGQALFESGELAQAQDVFQSALDLDPENLIALRHLGDIARTRGDAGAARRWYERVLDADPRNDDIAALLATLAQRHTPRTATPIAPMPVVQEEPAAFGVDDDPFSAPDSPAWHTPSFLTPLASAAIPAEPESREAEIRAEFVNEAGAEDLLDLDFSAEALTGVNAEVAEGEEVAEEVGEEPRFEGATVEAMAMMDESYDAGDVVGQTVGAEAGDDGNTDAIADAADAAEVEWAESDALTAALGAFAAHDPIEVASEPPMMDAEPAAWATRSAPDASEDENHSSAETDEAFGVARADTNGLVSDELSSSAAAAPFAYPSESYDDDAFEEGLVAQQWPDATALSGRHFSPSRGVTPISSEVVADAFGESANDEGAVLEAKAEDSASFESPLEVSEESSDESMNIVSPELSWTAMGHDAVDATEDDTVEAAADDTVEAAADDTVEAAADDTVEAAADDTVEAAEDDAVERAEYNAIDATQDHASGAAEEHANAAIGNDSVAATNDELVDATLDDVVEASDAEPGDARQHEAQTANAEFAEFEEFGESEGEADVDENSPDFAADIPWLSVTEDEREADEELGLSHANAELQDAELAADHADVDEPEVVEAQAEHARADEPQTEDTVAAELTNAPESPAFVTETMAELLVAQGFVDRAITVYEELVSRRPYDAVLTSRLSELQAMKQTEVVAESAPTFTPAPMPAWSATPIRGGTPVRSATPFRSLAPIASPVLPLVAPPARRTARELFATLAGMRVARRTPASGSATVPMPTPADGLASLFGETTAFSQDDHSAHSLASAFGSGEGVDPGPSLFTSAGTEDESSSGTASAPAHPSPVSRPHASGSAFSFDRFFPDPATSRAAAVPSSDSDVSQTPASGVASGSGDAEDSGGPPSAGADLAQFSHWLKGLSNS